jgi:hypothetical protein
MEIEAVATRVARTEPRRFGRGSGFAAAAHAGTGPRTERGPPRH